MGNLRRAYAALVAKSPPVKPEEWKVTGPGHHSYKVTGYEQDINKAFKGTLTFTLLRDNEDTLTLAGAVDDEGAETITLNDTPEKNADIDGDLAGTLIQFFPPKFRLDVVLHFRYDDPKDDDGRADFRLQARMGSGNVIPKLGV